MHEEIANRIDIRRIFKTSKQVMEEAYENILKYRRGELIPAKTGYDYIDEALLGGIFPQHAIAIGARPSVGKSYVAQKILENVMNPMINPQAEDYFLVNCEFEMNPQDLLLRRMSQDMKKRAPEILRRQDSNTVEEMRMFEILQGEIRNNIIYIDAPCTVKEFEAAVYHIATKHKDKRLIIFKVDHIALIKRMGLDPKSAIDDLVAVMNEAKLVYKNIFFLIISQFNREIEGRIKSPQEQPPRLSDFYQSDTLGQLCTLMIGLHNPRRYGLDKYMIFGKDWYQTLDRFKTENKTSFRTAGLVFHHILKVRQVSMEELTNTIHPEILPGHGWMYGEGGTKFVNPNQPPTPPKLYTVEDVTDNQDQEQEVKEEQSVYKKKKRMRLTVEENEYLISKFLLVLTEFAGDEREMFLINSIHDKAVADMNYRLPSLISRERKRRVIELLKEGTRIIKDFSGYAGDMGMINEYDRLKKEIGTVQDQLGDVEGQLRAAGEVIKKELDMIADRIKEDLLDRELAKSNAEAERKAKVDPRYEVALGDYKEMLEVIFTTRNKYSTVDSVHDDLRQSVSTGRNSIIKEGYNS